MGEEVILQASSPVSAMSMFMRYRSQKDDTFHGKVASALRKSVWRTCCCEEWLIDISRTHTKV